MILKKIGIRSGFVVMLILITGLGLYKTVRTNTREDRDTRNAKSQETPSRETSSRETVLRETALRETLTQDTPAREISPQKTESRETLPRAASQEIKPQASRHACVSSPDGALTLTGTLVAGEILNVGSIAYGIAQKIYYKEHDEVKKGQLLLEIDIAVGDFEIREAKAELEAAEAAYAYEEAFFQRQKKLYEADQISQNDFEKSRRDRDVARAQVDLKSAAHEKKIKTFSTTKIYAPADGIVIKNNITLGQLATSFETKDALLTIANIDCMKAQFEIDEKRRSEIREGQSIVLQVDAECDIVCRSSVASITPTTGEKFIVETKPFINKKHVARPGMIVRGTFTPRSPQAAREKIVLSAFDETQPGDARQAAASRVESSYASPARQTTFPSGPSIFAKALVTGELHEKS